MGDVNQLVHDMTEFSKINEQFNNVFKLINTDKKLSDGQKVAILLNYIAKEIIIIPQYFQSILKYFPKEVPLLLAQATAFTDEFPFSNPRHIVNCILISKVCKYRPDLKSYALKYFEQYSAPFDEPQIGPTKSKRSRIALADNIYIEDLDIVEASYFVLKSDSTFFRHKWKWSEFVKKYSKHSDCKTQWLACQTIAIVMGLNEAALKSLILQRLSDELDRELTIEFDRNCTLTNNSQETHSLDQHPLILQKCIDLPEVVAISGIYVPAQNGPRSDLLVDVPSTYNNLRKIALGLSCGKALCLQGAVGSGKTVLIEHMAAKTGRKLGESFVKVQLGDQTDSKMLLGTYRCSDTPGEFIWQPGVLTQAVMQGSWLVLEDIDLASMDIASVIASLLENKALTVPGYRDLVQISPGFQLFITQRLTITSSGQRQKRTSNALHLLEKQMLQITIDPLTSPELKHILHVLYPKFDTIADRLIEVFEIFSEQKSDLSRKHGRVISTRDFFKWCARAAINFDVKSQESALKVLQNAIDVFCCSISNYTEALELAKNICTHLGIINNKAEYYFESYKPVVRLTTDRLISERVSLIREHSIYSKPAKFCFTQPAAILLERIMCCIKLKEPILLVGETGTGKTSAVQYLAQILGKKLIVINMNQQSDSADLLGGFKPVDLKLIIAPLKKEFESVFRDYFDTESNREFLSKVTFAFNKQKYLHLVLMMKKSASAALTRLSSLVNDNDDNEKKEKDKKFVERWRTVSDKLYKVEAQIKHGNALYFAFIEGSLVKAVQEGSWVLLDEINLANAETLECLSGLLEDSKSSLCLLERGDKAPVKRHPNFTLFACMNPASNIGKKDLPTGLRNRFTEFYVDELTNKNDLVLLVNSYLDAMSLRESAVLKIVDFYLRIRKEMQLSLCDGIGHKPHFSLRSLCRALMIAAKNPCGTFSRSLYEAFCLSFLTQLDSASYAIVRDLIESYLFTGEKKVKSILKQGIPEPKEPGSTFLEFEGYWVKKGHLEPQTPDDYILTNSVRRNLKDLARVVSIGKLPVLLQGDTSVGKTSLITYLAKSSGNKCVRINNHEHTDLQEYIGSYVADTSGKLVFREGVLVEAMRKGHWIILDELNLAPSDVLEALNRVLDDNRELFIPETQETVKADLNFMLFATQNPPGVYGGRKMLSRAFRNRFVELHFNEIPSDELQFILHKRCEMPDSYAKRMISVMTDLQIRRRGSAAFAGKQGFITLRDLFRWGERYRLARQTSNLYDWNQHLVDEGYLVLAGKVRKQDEKEEIIVVLQKHWGRKVELNNLFSLHKTTSTVTKHILENIEKHKFQYPKIVWTFNMRRLGVLTAKALEFKEPVLLVGETGGGKTTVCQLIAEMNGQSLVSINCHMHTESSDFIGGLRPVRDHSKDSKSLFEWVDGPLLHAMSKGNVFLADEISLADDSVLERLNSLLEPERTLLLAEKGIDLNNPNNSETIVAHPHFMFIGTMNPGGDFGKKELSPALRNRFTEIWCESCTESDDLVSIMNRNLILPNDTLYNFGQKMMEFIEWFRSTEIGKRYTISIRDILTWVQFMNEFASDDSKTIAAYIYGAQLVFLDSLGSGVSSTENMTSLTKFKGECQKFLNKQMDNQFNGTAPNLGNIIRTDSHFGVEPFSIQLGAEKSSRDELSFNAPTTICNTFNILKGMQLHKAILLEGSPGVGKTSLVIALAKVSRHKIFRVNLSDQTDISDLFGADLPVEGGTGGQFSWRDGPLLQALKEGSWILLDELNLASQSVLEGLNACLDHRGEIFIPELGKTFIVQPGTRFFACQNPTKQGGSRRGLPKSFLNRFIQVYVSPFTPEDMRVILTNQFPILPTEMISKMIDFNYKLALSLDQHAIGNKGAPWECNLRDLTRWCQATIFHYENNQSPDKVLSPEYTAELIYVSRMRTISDRQKVEEIFKDVMGCTLKGTKPVSYIATDEVYFGEARLKRAQDQLNDHVLNQGHDHLLLRAQSNVLRSLTYCVNQNWMAILVGNSGVGKSSVVKTLANLAGKTLKTLPVTSAMDTTDILGGFEQTNYSRHLEEIAKQVERLTLMTVQNLLLEEKDSKAVFLLEFWEEYLNISESKTVTMDEEVQLFTRLIIKLESLLKELYMKCASSEEGNVLLELMTKCSAILGNVENDKSLSAGGRFEWVDSVLVKCLQEGSWLLVDNVNLCSAAVLDRLNGLLEPNGVLTVSEKGVDENGKMFIVKPHKDFRIFLTMDPKNGEISRAMRNRGVEIYMLNDSEVTGSNTFDIKSMIQLQGLSDQKLIKALLKVHQFVSSIILSEKPGVSELLQCSSLISQRLLHGIDSTEAFIHACIEVYYKTRNLSEFNCNNVLELMQDGIRRNLVTGDDSLDFYAREVSLNTRNLNNWSILEKVKQQSSIYLQSVELFDDNLKKARQIGDPTSRQIPEFLGRISKANSGSSKELSIWNDIETVKINNEFFTKINFYTLANLLSISFSLSTLSDVDWKEEYIQKVGKQSKWAVALDRFVRVTKILGIRDSHLPFDHQWINSVIKNDNSDKINYTLQIEIYTLHDALQIRYSPNNSLYNYLLSVQKNERLEGFSNPILSNYLNLRGKYFTFVKMLFRSFSNDIEMEGMVLKLIELLSWRLALHGFLTSIRIPETAHQAFESKMDMLTLYYKWFHKYSVRAVAQLLKIDVTEGLQLILDDINEKMEFHFSTIHKTASNYKKLNNVPDFYTSESQLATLDVLRKYDLFDPSNNSRKILAVLKNSPELRKRLINLQSHHLEEDLLDELSFLASFDINEVGTNLKLQELEVLPVADILMQMFLLSMIKSIGSRNFSDVTSLNNNILLNADFNGVLLKYKETRDVKLLHEIKKCFYLAAANSPSARPDQFIDGTDNSEITLSIAGVEPVFLTTIIKLLISLDDKSTTLGNFQDVEAQRQFLRIALWDNMQALSGDQFDFISSNVAILEENINSFNSRLQKALELHNQTEIKDSTLKPIISRIRSKHSELKQGHSNDIPISGIGDLHMNLSFAEMYLNSLLPAVDPLAKKAMKKNHLVYVLNMFEQMKTSFELHNSVFTNDEECQHPYYAIIKKSIRELEIKLNKYGDGINAGVKNYTYSFVVQQIKYAFASIFKASILTDLETCDNLILAIKTEGLNDSTVEKIQKHVKIFESSIPSFEKIIQDWKQYRGSYPDIVEPLLANVAQFLYGFKLKLWSIKREFVKLTYATLYEIDLETELTNLVALPSINGNTASLNALVDCYTLQRTGSFVANILCAQQPNYIKEETNVKLLTCEIQESFNQCLVRGQIGRGLSKSSFKKFVTLVDHFICIRNKQQESQEKEKAEAESLYKTRTKCENKTDEEQFEEDLNDLFPNYHVKDFADFQEKQLSDSIAEPVEKHQSTTQFITENDLRVIVDLHTKLFNNFTRTEWLVPQLNKNVRTDYVTPLMERYRLVRRLLESQQHYFQYHTESKLYPSLAVLLDASSDYNSRNDSVAEPSSPTKAKRTRHFYKDPDVDEAKSCLPILQILKVKVKELLLEWPDQPTLNSILVVIDRITNFDIKSPLSRFLTGLDILLSKCYEWEQVAHSGVSLTSAIPDLIAKIIEWRKIELSRWKDLLDTTYTDLAKTYSNWWLYLYNLMRQYLSTEQVSSTELVDTLQKFITKSPIVEFFGRVKLLLQFHCHVLILPATEKSESLINILWNLYNYFNQFQSLISNKVKELRSPIDKKLKDFVKIVRWKDVNYWAVKDTVVKMHKGLHKFVREYKDLLLQPVTPYLINHSSDGLIESVGIWDRPQRQNPKAYHYTLDVDSYIIKGSIKNTPYLLKARKICKETILGANYPNLVTSLDSFVSDIIETSSHLGKLEIDTAQPKEKQKSQAKNILQQKHRALADLFQALSKIGLSYKTGIMEKKLKDPVEDFIVKPIDLCASFAFFTLNRSEEKMLTIWDSCELYYYRSLMRFDMLESALISPAKDLGMQNVQRCQGFASHLLNLCQKQKQSLINATRSHYILRGYGKQLHEVADFPDFLTSTMLLDIQNALSSTITIADQIEIILDACPANEINDTYFIQVPLLDVREDKFLRKNDERWKKAHFYLNDVKSLTNKILHLIQRSTVDPNLGTTVKGYRYVPFNHKSQLFTELHNLTDCLNKLQTHFAPIKVIDSLSWLASLFDEIIKKHEETSTPISHNEFEKSLNKLTKSLLLVMQNIYKKYQTGGMSSKPSSEVDAAEDMGLQENHLKALLADNLSLDIATLDLMQISKNAGKIVKILLDGAAYADEKMRTQITRTIPLYDQILQLSQYFITQQVAAYRTTCKLTSVLLNIFIDLASKGFCIPPEFSDELDKEGVSKPSDGMGLGEGEGERDVSDKIESEDQLDDAQPAGKEKENNEDPDCKEEDKGIEMSEDFDSKLQDKKPGDENEDESQSDNSDAEDQMGETEKGADRLDKEIWGDDEEKDADDEGDDNTEEDGTGGEKDGDDQLDAKDEDVKQKPQNKDPTPDQKGDSEENKKEINELNEPEYDDEQVDPYHGNQAELPEPEPMDLPDDLQLDEGEEKDGEQPEENPFDVDQMKDQTVPEENLELPPSPKEQQNDEAQGFSSDDEDIAQNDENDKTEDSNEDSQNQEEPTGQDNAEATNPEEESAIENDVDLNESALDENPSNQENVEAMDVDDVTATDKTQATESENLKSNQPIEETCQEDKPDKEGVGQSQMEENQSGHSAQTNAPQDLRSSHEEEKAEQNQKEKPGQSDSHRSLGDIAESVEKKLKALNATDDNTTEQERNADMYQHIKEAKEEKSTQVLDAATKEQAEEQNKEITHKDDEIEDETMDVEGASDVPESKQEEMDVDVTDTENQQPLKQDQNKNKSERSKQHPDGEILEEIDNVDVEGDVIKTSTVSRGVESSYHTQYHLLQEAAASKLTQEEINNIREQVEQELSCWKSRPSTIEAEQTWQKISAVTSNLAQDLSEQLRLVLEPTKASHLKGDFRTGRRINMRKIIPYIASQFRKDKIWLRRTKPSKREYQIVLAIDDSSSMKDNHSKELAFESVALVSKALSLLESGQLAVVGFGKDVEIHHKLTEPFTDKSGVDLLQNFQFNQDKTHIGKLVHFVTEMFEQNNIQATVLNAKLLVIVSDGRGVFSEGKTYVMQALRQAKLANVFIVFVIIDNPENQNSVLDIRSVTFNEGKMRVESYMDEFPFSFYIILRDINSLPGVLSDALMQWFEMVTCE